MAALCTYQVISSQLQGFCSEVRYALVTFWQFLHNFFSPASLLGEVRQNWESYRCTLYLYRTCFHQVPTFSTLSLSSHLDLGPILIEPSKTFFSPARISTCSSCTILFHSWYDVETVSPLKPHSISQQKSAPLQAL